MLTDFLKSVIVFCSSFAALLNGSRYLLTGNADKNVASGGFFREFLCVIITGFFSMACAVIFQMLPIYHGLKDGFGLHSEVILCILFAIYIGIVVWHDRTPKPNVSSWLIIYLNTCKRCS